MTNTLHRYGAAESFRDDFVVFAIASKGRNDEGALAKLRRFLEIAARSSPSIWGTPFTAARCGLRVK